MTFNVVDKTTGKEVTESTISIIAKQAKNKGLFKTMDVDQFYVGEDGQLVLADKCGNIAGVMMDFFEAVLENNEPDEADKIVSKIGDVKVGGSIGLTREMLEGVSAERRVDR